MLSKLDIVVNDWMVSFYITQMSWGFSIQKQNYQFAFNKLEKKTVITPVLTLIRLNITVQTLSTTKLEINKGGSRGELIFSHTPLNIWMKKKMWKTAIHRLKHTQKWYYRKATITPPAFKLTNLADKNGIHLIPIRLVFCMHDTFHRQTLGNTISHK